MVRWRNKRCAVCGAPATMRGARVTLRDGRPRWWIAFRLWLAPKTYLCKSHRPETIAQVMELIQS